MTAETPDFFPEYQSLINDKLNAYIEEYTCNDVRLTEAIKYSSLLGGKRIRPILTLATANCLGTSKTSTLPLACAVELIHAYSLIHDDLPAMDNDALRRGKPTCHIAFDEATAILAGDALQTMAFELLANQTTLNHSATVTAIQILAKASGPRGMVYGQALDFDAVGKKIDLTALEKMHRHKTGVLIEASVMIGALTSANPLSNTQISLFQRYAQAIGLAFQVQDDILDITSDTHTLGKTQGADLALNKPTYPALLGLDGAKEKLNHLHNEALACLQQLREYNTQQLEQISHFIIARIQ